MWLIVSWWHVERRSNLQHVSCEFKLSNHEFVFFFDRIFMQLSSKLNQYTRKVLPPFNMSPKTIRHWLFKYSSCILTNLTKTVSVWIEVLINIVTSGLKSLEMNEHKWGYGATTTKTFSFLSGGVSDSGSNNNIVFCQKQNLFQLKSISALFPRVSCTKRGKKSKALCWNYVVVDFSIYNLYSELYIIIYSIMKWVLRYRPKLERDQCFLVENTYLAFYDLRFISLWS